MSMQQKSALAPTPVLKAEHPFIKSGEIERLYSAKVAAELGLKLDQGNVSTCLSGAGKAFVMADKVRKPGQPVRYTLSRKGLAHVESILNK